ncbi:unnamed protein product [Withania somnifera]
MAIVGQPKRIQEISAEGEQPPPEFFVKDTILAGNLGSVPIEIPIIDLNLLSLDPTSEAYIDEINKLLSALSSWGVFQVIGHGMSSSYLDEIRNLNKTFFLYQWKKSKSMLVLLMDLKDMEVTQFSDMFQEYCKKVILLTETLLRIFARSQNLWEDTFSKEIGEKPLVQARFNLYPKCPTPDKILGVKAHADASIITTLLQDREVEGLQVLKNGTWYGVPTIPHALLINVGDQLEIMSNGIFKSPIHRVAANSERERMSLAVFYSPDYEKEIESLEGLISSERPRMFRKVKNYPAISFNSFHSGKIAIDTVRISPSD